MRFPLGDHPTAKIRSGSTPLVGFTAALHIVPLIGIQNGPGHRIPYLYRLVKRARSDVLPIRRPGNRAYRVGMATIGIRMISGRSVQDLHVLSVDPEAICVLSGDHTIEFMLPLWPR